jgi:hypothetical protein
MTITSKAIWNSVNTQPQIKNQISDGIPLTNMEATHHNHPRMSMLARKVARSSDLGSRRSPAPIRYVQSLALFELLLLQPRRFDGLHPLG